MHSIRYKITLLTLVFILVGVLSVGSVSILSIRSEGSKSSQQEMTLVCRNLQMTIDGYLNSIEQSVGMVSRYAGESLSSSELVDGGIVGSTGAGASLEGRKRSSEQQAQLDSHLLEHTEQVETVFRSVANHTSGVIAYYYRLNSELSDEAEGFFYAKVDSSAFSPHVPTDLRLYPADDVSHVGWYYIPLERGRPSWLSPYFNVNLGIRMISYVIPLYKAGTFIGVIGMDIDYDTLVNQVRNITLYDSGYACLTEADGTIVYHPRLPMGSNINELYPQKTGSVAEILSHQESSSVVSNDVDGVKRRLAFTTLSNDMKLVVSVPVSEINASWLRLMNLIGLASILLLVAFIALMTVSLKRITEPLARLTEGSRRILSGDYDVELSYDGDDELGILTRTFQQLVNHLKIYIRDLNSKAYQDALTGVKNKAAFDISQRKLNDVIMISGPGEPVEFAIVMLDCNGLKLINDRCGHDKGDVFLRTSCTLICKVFAHSPVFRIGGDEFVVLLQKEDYLRREQLLKLFRLRAHDINETAHEDWERVDIAIGMAEYTPKQDWNVESVLHRADALMYADKRRTKAKKRMDSQKA